MEPRRRLRVVSLSLSPSGVMRRKSARKKNRSQGFAQLFFLLTVILFSFCACATVFARTVAPKNYIMHKICHIFTISTACFLYGLPRGLLLLYAIPCRFVSLRNLKFNTLFFYKNIFCKNIEAEI